MTNPNANYLRLQLTHRFDRLLKQKIRLALVERVDISAITIETADGGLDRVRSFGGVGQH